jgi:hypothetical protein
MVIGVTQIAHVITPRVLGLQATSRIAWAPIATEAWQVSPPRVFPLHGSKTVCILTFLPP